MTNKERIVRLENAHRALHARLEGLTMVCRVMLPLISLPQAAKRRMMLVAYDGLSEHMEKSVFDDEFQQDARATIDELFETILAPLNPKAHDA